MKHVAGPCRSVVLLLALAGLRSGGAPPQPQVGFTAGTSGTHNMEWPGVAERTYFIQWSWDLTAWNIAPYMTHGEATQGLHSYGAESTTPAFFVRLKYADIPTADAELADFDNDGLGNLIEVNLGTDPLDADSDNDGISDGVEVANSGNPLSNTDGDALMAGDSDGDGLNDAAELAFGTSPTLWDSDGDGVSDADDLFPLDLERHNFPPSDPADQTGPLVTLEAPSNAVFVSGP